MKFCNGCKKNKQFSEYSRSSRNKNGIQSRCKSCCSGLSKYENLSPQARENERQRKKLYKKSNPDVVAAINKKTVSKRKQISIECTTAEVKMFMEENEFCAQCGSTEELTLDHIIPVSWGVLSRHGLDNFQVLCNKCNGTKSAKWSVDLRPHPNMDQIDVLSMLQ